MPEFALDHAQFQTLLDADAITDLEFGPPTPGPLTVYVSARSAVILGPAPTPLNPAGQGIGPEAGLALGDDGGIRTTARLRRPVGPVGGGLGDDGVFDPGGGFDPPPPPPPILPEAFNLEVVRPDGSVVATSQGPLAFEVPRPAPSPLPRPSVGTIPGSSVGRRWTLRVTNTSRFSASVTINMFFHGHRPVLSRDIDLDFINEKLDLVFNAPQPIQIAFRNREVGRVLNIPITHTFVVVEASPAMLELHPELAELERDLGARVFTEETASYNISIRATLHDGDLALCASVSFPSFRGRIDAISVIDALGHDVAATVGNLIVDLTPADRPIISVRNLAFDVFLVLRPRGVYLRVGPTFEVLTSPRIELEPSWATVVVEALMRVAFGRLLPEAASTAFHANASSLLGWLLGDRGREVVGSVEELKLKYAGDPPRPPLVSLGEDFDTTPGRLDPGNLAKIDHIVVVMMENRSFDHMLGFLSLPGSGNDGRVGAGRADVDGLSGLETNPLDTLGNRTRVFSLATSRPPTPGLGAAHETRGTKFPHDPGHSYKATEAQRGGYDIRLPNRMLARRIDDTDTDIDPVPVPPRVFRVGRNEGFVLDFSRVLGGRVSALEEALLRGEVMGYHPAEHVPTYAFLADEYAVCDRWFASHPGHTWPNRFVSLTGRLNIGPNGLPEVDNPPLSTFDPLETTTIFDHLTAGGVDWRYFEHDFCMLRLFSAYTFDTERVVSIADPDRGFFALARRGQLPPVTYLEPDLTDVPPGGDDHPPADIRAGQAFIRSVYDALAEGPQEQWEKTLLIITYDEHGGFYDHVHPDSMPLFDTSAPDRNAFAPIALDPESRAPIDHYGFRVPSLIVSPWIPAGTVSSQTYDHTSILKTIMARFLGDAPPDMGLRTLLASDVGSLLSLDRPRRARRPPAFEYAGTGADTVAFHVGAPEDDFRAFLSGVRTRLRGTGRGGIPVRPGMLRMEERPGEE